jgi:rhodanese-related sulfurtransferase
MKMNHSGSPNELSTEELYTWIQNAKAFDLIDTLKSDTYARRHLPKAKNACVFEVTFLDQIEALIPQRDRCVVVYGVSSKSHDARTAAAKLLQAGYADVHMLKGGSEAWQAAGLPVEGEAVEQPIDPQIQLSLVDRSYRIDAQQSTIEWRGRNPNTTHYGTVAIHNGHIEVKNKIITGRFEIRMDSITNINLEGDDLQPVLVSHLKSDDFFFTKVFPTASFTIDNAMPVPDPYLSLPNYHIKGTLELRGVKAPLDFLATLTTTTEMELKAEAHFDFDRTKWGVIYGSTRFFECLGMHMVFDLISIQVNLTAT